MRPSSHTIFTGSQLQQFEKLGSTNRFLRDKVADENGFISEGFTVITDDQFEGRGQLGSTWKSEPGKNLTFSILYRPIFLRPMQIFYLNKAVSLALRNSIAEFLPGIEVQIKWPNDIYVLSKKIAGILIENNITTDKIQYSIIGIGVNVNQDEFEPSLTNAISLKTAKLEETNLQELFDHICIEIENQYLLLKRSDFNSINMHYHKHLYKAGCEIQFKSHHKIFKGTIEQVDDSGKLNVIVDGSIEKYEVKEIQFL